MLFWHTNYVTQDFNIILLVFYCCMNTWSCLMPHQTTGHPVHFIYVDLVAALQHLRHRKVILITSPATDHLEMPGIEPSGWARTAHSLPLMLPHSRCLSVILHSSTLVISGIFLQQCFSQQKPVKHNNVNFIKIQGYNIQIDHEC